jgi:Icc-related predicted phosphoesterase
MKILCVSDQIDPLVYTNSIRERFKDVDLILSAGDLPMEYLDFIVSSLNKPLLYIAGNHHTRVPGRGKSFMIPAYAADDENDSFGACYVDSKIHVEEGFIVAGLGGSMRYNLGENQFTDFQMYRRILKMLPGLIFNRIFRGRFVDVLLTHASPRGIHDKEDRCHQGFKAFLWFMRVFKPRYLIHGHIHLYDLSEVRMTWYQKTLVINAFNHHVIDTEISAFAPVQEKKTEPGAE